ncbi:hypothetical protein BS47DRAFT_1341723 [Hydnum rufescens UP504]|uniref:precorrin-2 dehydrogenase n=1 Tax=Hydnum rufescens UP504 TaxID=1448309 RepID=A0A9P6B160_9AGAM|nr:hypothetical protein BS47DRAFT_1341723 [Hydnum rufescens UP504]
MTELPPPPPPPRLAFPPIEYGGSLLLAWQLRNKRVLIVGGGEVAAGRLRSVLEADAFVTLIAPSSNLHPEVRFRVWSDPRATSRITYHDRNFHLPSPSSPVVEDSSEPDDLEGIDVVLTAIDDVETSRKIYELAHERRIPTNVADIPPSCDFYFGSQIRSGPLQIMVSTNGKGPKLASIIRKRLEGRLEELGGKRGLGEIVERVGALRERLRERAPDVGGSLGKRRMRWMIELCDTWSLEELGELDDVMMERLLDEGWEKGGKVPSFLSMGGVRAVGRDWTGRIVEWASVDHAVHLAVGVTVGAVVSFAVCRRLMPTT